MSRYYYVDANRQKAGPVSTEDFKRLGINAKTFVWTKGMKSWTKVEDIPELIELFEQELSQSATLPIENSVAVETALNEKKQESVWKKYKIHIVVASVVVFGTLLFWFFSRESANGIRQNKGNVSLSSRLDSASYAYGVLFGNEYANFQDVGTVVPGKAMSLDCFILGFMPAIRRDYASLAMSEEAANVFVKNFQNRIKAGRISHLDDASCSELDSASYAYGVIFGSQYASFQDSGTVVSGKVMSLDYFILGFVSAIRRDSASLVLSVTEADIFLENFKNKKGIF